MLVQDASPPDDLLGTVLDGRYRIIRSIGRGGMGRVYEGERVGLARPVAIKLLDPMGAPQDNDRARFAREAAAAGRIDHPNCVGVIDFGVTPRDVPYLVMDLVVGVTLSDELARVGRMQVGRALHIARHVLRGLRHAHGLGVVHRDLTPRNVILVARDGDSDFARILDFGLAKMVGADAGPRDEKITRTGFICGTPRYMSPEQALGQPADTRSDLYAVSILAYEMIAGAPPFAADEALRVLMMHVGQPVPPLDVDVPAGIEAVIRAGLAKEPTERPQSADAYLDALDRADVSPEVSTGNTDDTVLASATWAAPRPRRLRRALGAAAILGVAAVALAASTGATDGERPRPAASDWQPREAAMAAGVDDDAPPWRHELNEAMAQTRAHRFDSAERTIDDLLRRYPDQGAIHLGLGHLNIARNWPAPALKAYRAGLARDPALRSDVFMIAGAISLLDSMSRWWDAARFLEFDVGTPAIAPLADAAAHDPSSIIRKRARDVLSRLAPP